MINLTNPGVPGTFNFDDYNVWIDAKVRKLEQIFGGEEFWKGKTVLEVGCGYGNVGKYFHEKYGAIVSFSDGREGNLPHIRTNNPGCEVFHLDQNNPWDLGDRKFDMIMHFGVLYHLTNWKQDIMYACKYTDLLVLESEVIDAFAADYERHSGEEAGDAHNAVSGQRIHTSPSGIEAEFTKNGFEFKRYDDKDLNAVYHHYDWKEENRLDLVGGRRRFWVARRKQ